MTFLAALRHDRSDAPWVFDGPINAESFRLYVEEVLVAALKNSSHPEICARQACLHLDVRLIAQNGVQQRTVDFDPALL